MLGSSLPSRQEESVVAKEDLNRHSEPLPFTIVRRMRTKPPIFPEDCRRARHPIPPKPNALCQRCWDGPFGAHGVWLFDVADGVQTKTAHIDAVSQWDMMWGANANSDVGCVWCSLANPQYNSRLWVASLAVASSVLQVELYLDDGAPPSGLHMIIPSCFRNTNRKWQRYAYTLSDDHPAAPHTKMHAPISDVGSTRAFELARGLMQRCEDEHKRCKALANPAEKTALPTRLIDCTDVSRPRLVQSAEGQCGRYVALSYVWGGDQPHKTTRANLARYEREMDLALLPQTIRDAIRVTHDFGFNLLWVDSLCIVQDSDTEKQHEIGCMHHIFRYASLTIIAASAENAGEGFLHNRQSSLPPYGIPIPILYPAAQSAAAPQLGVLTLYPERSLPGARNYNDEPISQRAWCLQEQLMSPRSLLFTSQTLQFRCQTATHSIGTSFYDWKLEPRLPDELFLQPPSIPVHDTHSVGWKVLHNKWREVVEEYSRRSMTEPSDKLVACAAIVGAFQRVLRSDYLAGLWGHSLLNDLLWIVHGRRRRSAPYRAPSWSWAAMDGKVDMRFPSDLDSAVAEVVRCQVSLKDPMLPFGQVTGGFLVLRARLLRILVQSSAQITDKFATRLSRDSGEDEAATDSIRWYDVKWTLSHDDVDSADNTHQAWAIPLLRTGRHGLHGLVVARAQPDGSHLAGGKTLYRRIGCFRWLECRSRIDNEEFLVRHLTDKEGPLQEIEII